MLRIGDPGVSAAYDRLRQREVEAYFEALDGDEQEDEDENEDNKLNE